VVDKTLTSLVMRGFFAASQDKRSMRTVCVGSIAVNFYGTGQARCVAL